MAVPSSLWAMNPLSQGCSRYPAGDLPVVSSQPTRQWWPAQENSAGGIAWGLAARPLLPALTAHSDYNGAQRELRQGALLPGSSGTGSCSLLSSQTRQAAHRLSLQLGVAAISQTRLLASPQTAPGLLRSR